jgi:phytoene synthase
MCIEIFGYKHSSTKDFAVNLGIALQLTNILRDIKKDAEKGRIYLPQEDLEKFGYSEKELLGCTYNSNFKEMMEYEALRAKEYFDKANTYLNLDDKSSMFAARAMQHIYERMLTKIIDADFDVFNKNIKVSKFEKVGISVGVWAKYNLVY